MTAYVKDVMSAKICPYCKSKTKTVTQKHIYGKTFKKGRYIICCVNYPLCDSYVGTDDEGITLGRLANKELRQKKKEAHAHFDPLWIDKHFDRSELYAMLSDHLDIPGKYTHIGMFNINTCNKVIEYCKKLLKSI